MTFWESAKLLVLKRCYTAGQQVEVALVCGRVTMRTMRGRLGVGTPSLHEVRSATGETEMPNRMTAGVGVRRAGDREQVDTGAL